MVTKYGFSDKLGAVNYGGDDEVFLGNDFTAHKNYSEHTACEIDEEIKRLVDEAYEEAMRILTEHDETLESIAKALLYVETINGEQFEALYTGEITAEALRESVEKADEEKKEQDEKESKEREELRKEEERKLMEELEKYDSDYLGDDEAQEEDEKPQCEKEKSPEEAEKPREEEEKDESNS